MLKRILIMTLICSSATAAFSQVVSVRTSFDKDSVMIGKPLHYNMMVESKPEVDVILPEYSDTITAEVEVLKSFPADTSFVDESRIITRRYLVTSFSPGWNTIPPQPVAFQSGDLSDTVYTTADLLTVLAPEVDTTQAFRPVKPPENAPVTVAEIFPWILIGTGGFLLVTLIWALVWIWLHKDNEPRQMISEPMEPAHVIAFRNLEMLRNEKLPEKGRVKEFYSRLTDIIRMYMVRQFGIHAMESTSLEILEAFSVHNSGGEDLNGKLERLLMLADLVKFAREDPAPAENETHLKSGEDFVEQTYRMFYTVAEESGAEASGANGESDKMEVENG